MAGGCYDPQVEKERHQEAVTRDIDLARTLLRDIERMGTEGICEVRFSHGLLSYYVLSCGEGEPITLTHIESGSVDSDNKWFRRPLTEEQRDAVIASVIEGLGRVALSEPEEPSDLPFASLLDSPSFHIVYADGMKLVGAMQGGFKKVTEQVEGKLGEVFRSVLPQDMDLDGTLASLASIEYVFGGFLGGYNSASVASKDADSGECRLVTKTTDMHAITPSGPVVSEREVPLSQEDWDGLLDAVRRMDLPNWNAKYENVGVSDGWWRRLEVMFGNGWALNVQGSNEWDGRCLPIAEFLIEHGVRDDEVGHSIELIRQHDGDA